jgi:hypothetical protein
MESHSGAAMHPLEPTRKGRIQQTSDRLVKYDIQHCPSRHANLSRQIWFRLPIQQSEVEGFESQMRASNWS